MSKTAPDNPAAELSEIIAHLGAAGAQVIDTDNPIIVAHLRAALAIARAASAAARGAAPQEQQGAGVPDDIRAAGWAVAVHNDYRLGGEAHTFWLFTKDGRAVKGEGTTDAEALNAVRQTIGLTSAPSTSAGEVK